MNTHTSFYHAPLWMIGICALALGESLFAQVAPPIQWEKAREAGSEEKLRSAAAATVPMNAQLAAMMLPLPETRPSTANTLYQKSIILFDGEKHTVIPIGSILHLPESLRGQVIAQPKGDFTFWPSFLKRNESWLAGKEVPLKMAKGDAKMAAAVLKETVKSNKVLVSVYRECPISVLEPVSGQGDRSAP